MSTDIKEKPLKVVLDTNIIISAIGFGGKPRAVLLLVLGKKIQAITSTILLAELEDVVNKKFLKLANVFKRVIKKLNKSFTIVQPTKTLQIARDIDDNRVLEAAVEGGCRYIITGDNDLLELGSFKNIQIITAEKFSSEFEMLSK